MPGTAKACDKATVRHPDRHGELLILCARIGFNP